MSLDGMDSGRSAQTAQLRLLFPAAALAVGALAFIVGYRAPQSSPSPSLSTTAVAAEQRGAADTSRDHMRPGAASHVQRDGLQLIGFAKIGFGETEELLTKASPEERERWARELGALPEQPLKMIALVGYYVAWLDLEPEEALRSLRNFPDILNRTRVFSALVSAVPPALLPELLEVVSGLTGPERSHLLPQCLAALSETDPPAAARFLDSHPQLVSTSDAAELISAWAADDIAAATQWLEASKFSGDSDVLRSLVQRWLAQDPAAAQEYVLRRRQSYGIEAAASTVASHLLNTSLAKAREFITLFGPERGASVVMGVINSAEDGRVASLAAWVSTFPPSIAESGVAGYALGRWSRLDPAQAVAWLRAQPVDQREPLLVRMMQFDPTPTAEVVSLAYTIRDAQQRDHALGSLVAMLGETSDEAAEQQIRAFGLPPSQTDHLLGLLAELGD